MIRDRFKWLLFPGMNLHARLRYRVLPRHFGRSDGDGRRQVLDAGCGNGMLAYQSYLRGNRVIGISIKQQEVERNRRLFNQYLRIPEQRLSFAAHNLYDMESLGEDFDEIICSEVLEHVVRDHHVCRSFWNVLKPGGILHLCCPNAEHPDNKNHTLDTAETGGHVRPGYTPDSYKALLEPIGFHLSEPIGLGGPLRQACNKRIIAAEEKLGFLPALVPFLLAWPWQCLDTTRPAIPYSLYVRAARTGEADQPRA